MRNVKIVADSSADILKLQTLPFAVAPLKIIADEKEFVAKAKELRLLLVPGSSFACPGYVRIAYCVAYDTIVRSEPSFRELAAFYGLVK